MYSGLHLFCVCAFRVVWLFLCVRIWLVCFACVGLFVCLCLVVNGFKCSVCAFGLYACSCSYAG